MLESRAPSTSMPSRLALRLRRADRRAGEWWNRDSPRRRHADCRWLRGSTRPTRRPYRLLAQYRAPAPDAEDAGHVAQRCAHVVLEFAARRGEIFDRAREIDLRLAGVQPSPTSIPMRFFSRLTPC